MQVNNIQLPPFANPHGVSLYVSVSQNSVSKSQSVKHILNLFLSDTPLLTNKIAAICIQYSRTKRDVLI